MSPDDRRAHASSLADVRLAHNVVAAFDGLKTARECILHLEQAGIGADSIALLGTDPDTPASEVNDPQAKTELPERIVTGAATGAAGAGALGALASVVIPGLGPVVAAGIWAVVGATAGGVIGGVSGIGGSEAWRETFMAVESGNVVVGVHTNNPEEADRGQEVLNECRPLTVKRFDEDSDR